MVKFQSTHPHGVRRLLWDGWEQLHGISIHAPAWGATFSGDYETVLEGDFNPRTRMGCDIGYGIYKDIVSQFQSTHPHGVRLVHLIHHKAI